MNEKQNGGAIRRFLFDYRFAKPSKLTVGYGVLDVPLRTSSSCAFLFYL